MKDFYGKDKLVVYLGPVTGKEFQDRYIDIAMSKDKVPIASTIIPINNVGDKETQPLFHAWIFYEKPGIEASKQPEQKVEPKKKLDL